MKVLFAGPSLYGTEWVAEREHEVEGVLCRPPAAQGDITRAVLEGATVIGLIDGRYEDVAAVWHKEILFALESDVRVYGAASMGALRAAECAPFGMIGIGAVFARYASGELADDAAVAQIHAPTELGSVPLTEALVNVEASIARFLELRAISGDEALALCHAARRLFFKKRTWKEILSRADLGSARCQRLGELIRRCKVDVKREDALALANYFAYVEPNRLEREDDWRFEVSPAWMRVLEHAQAYVGSAGSGAA